MFRRVALYAVVVTAVLLAVSVSVFLGEVAWEAPWLCTPGPSYGGVTTTSMLVSFAGFAYGFGGHGGAHNLCTRHVPPSWNHDRRLASSKATHPSSS